jgi:hypothetical protein
VAEEPENLMLHILRRLESKVETGFAATDARADATNERIDKLAMSVTLDIRDVRAELAAMEKRLVDSQAELRRAIMFYHASVSGHGILITELDERLRHLESAVKLLLSEPH